MALNFVVEHSIHVCNIFSLFFLSIKRFCSLLLVLLLIWLCLCKKLIVHNRIRLHLTVTESIDKSIESIEVLIALFYFLPSYIFLYFTENRQN